MATQPKYPVEPRRPGPQPVEARIARQQRNFKWILLAATVLVAALVIFLAVWLLNFGGGSPQEHPKPHQPPAPSSQTMPSRIARRPPLYAWVK